MKLRLPQLLLSALLFGMSFSVIHAETIAWDDGAAYNVSRALKNQNSYTFTFQGTSDNTFSFSNNKDGIFYWEPNSGGTLNLIGSEGLPHLSFDGNSLDNKQGNAASGPVIHIYNGSSTISHFGTLSVSNNISGYNGGAFYVYGGSLIFDSINSIQFIDNTAKEAGGVIGGGNVNVTFSHILKDITFTKNVSQSTNKHNSGSVISCSGEIVFSDVGGKIIVEDNVDNSQIAAIRGASILFTNVKGDIEFKDNQSRALSASGKIEFNNIEGGLLFDGHHSANQGGTIASELAGTPNIFAVVFQDIKGGIILRNSIGNTGAGISAVNAGNVLFDGITGDILFELNRVLSGPAAVIRAGNLTMTNITGNLTFHDNKCAADSITANYGGAIHSSASSGEGVLISDVSGNVIFTENETNSTEGKTRGGAIWSNLGTTITKVGGDIEFSNNKANSDNSTGEGGAIYSKKAVQLEADGAIVFRKNQSTTIAAAIYASSADISMSAGAKGILFDGNIAGSSGGALYTSGNVSLETDGAIVFNANQAGSDAAAIYAAALTMSAGNGGIVFKDNQSINGKGGAINVGTALTLKALAGDIVFSNNKDKDGANDIHIRKNSSAKNPSVTLDASHDRSIVFDGTVSIAYSADISINTSKGSTGMVVFRADNGISASQTTGALQNISIGAGTAVISRMSGQGTVSVSSGATLISGFTTTVLTENGSKALQSTTGFEGFNAEFKIEQGAQLGSSVVNKGEETWNINFDDLKKSQAQAWQGIEGTDLAQFGSVYLQGNVVLSTSHWDHNDTLVVGEGSWASIKGEMSGTIILQGGSVDASNADNALLNGDRIRGSLGSMLTTDAQTIVYLGDNTLGYDIIGKDGASAAAIRVGNGDKSPSITTGGTWGSDSIELQSGSIIALESAKIGSGNADSLMSIAGSARFKNQGGMVNNALLLKSGALLSGSGYYKEINMQEGSRMDIGVGSESGFLIANSIQIVDPTSRHFRLAPQGNTDTTLGFRVDGGRAASLGDTGAGTHSHITAQTINLTGMSIEITLGEHLANLGSREFSLSLIQGENGGGNALQDFILQGRQDLVEDGSLLLSWNGNSLNFSGTLNSNTVVNLLSPEGSRLANVLWSSTRSLSTFSQLATSQLKTIHAGATNIWSSGLGDFTSASNSGSISGFDYQGGGYAMGIDHGFKVQAKDTVTAGLAFGQSFGSHQSNDTLLNIHQRGVMAALYSQYARKVSEKHDCALTGSIAYGDTDNWGTIGLEAGNAAPHHTWKSEAFSADLMFRWKSKITDHSSLTPFIGISYLYGSQDNIALQGTSSKRSFSDSSLQRWVLPVGLEYSRLTSLGNGQTLLSFMSLAYQGDMARNDASVKMNILGTPTRVKGTQPSRSAFVFNAGCQWAITPKWSASTNYNLEVRSEMTQQAVTATISYSF